MGGWVPYWGDGAGHTMVSSASLPIDEVYTFGWRRIYATLISLRVWFGDQRSDMQGCARNVQSDHSTEMVTTKHLSRDFWLIWWTPFDQFGSKWLGLLLLENGSSKISINRLTESPEKDSVIELGTLYYLMSWHDTSPPHRNHWRRLHGFMAGSPGLSFGDHRQVRRLSRYSYSDQHMNWIFLSRTKTCLDQHKIEYFYPGYFFKDQNTNKIFCPRTKRIQINTWIAQSMCYRPLYNRVSRSKWNNLTQLKKGLSHDHKVWVGLASKGWQWLSQVFVLGLGLVNYNYE